MNFGWESEAERLKRYMKMAPKRKLELLYELKRFTQKYSTKIRLKHASLVKN